MYKYFLAISRLYYRFTISEYESRYRILRINSHYGILLADKQIAYKFFHDYLEFFPKLYFHINNGRFIRNGSGGKSIEDLLKILIKENRLIAKATRSYGGKDIYLLEYDQKQDQLFFDKEKVKKEVFFDKILSLKGDYIVTEYVKQSEYSNKINPNSVNTIRIMTLYDEGSHECWIAGTTHRFGTVNSGYVDNMHSGGISVAVDVDTGMLGRCYTENDLKEIFITETHPDTGVLITGTFIHNWEFIKEKIVEMARYAFKNPYIGWDVVPCEKGFKIVEINDCPDIQLIQQHVPALLDERNRKFFAKYHIKPKK